MRTCWLRIPLLVVATIVTHDAYMATTGHAVVAAGDIPAEHHGGTHRHHQAPLAQEHRQADPAEALGHCDSLRVAAPLNRDMSPSFDTVPTALLPDPASLMLFASTSRAIVETPPSHPPDLNRAFFQVYLIEADALIRTSAHHLVQGSLPPPIVIPRHEAAQRYL